MIESKTYTLSELLPILEELIPEAFSYAKQSTSSYFIGLSPCGSDEWQQGIFCEEAVIKHPEFVVFYEVQPDGTVYIWDDKEVDAEDADETGLPN